MAADTAARMRRMRYRRAMGVRVVPVEVGIDTIEVLVEQGYLEHGEIRDLQAVADATSRFLEDAADRVTRNAVTLDRW